MRAYLQHALAQRGGAQRLFYIGPCFRAERPQKGRFRQFHQFGTELLGSADPRADAEVIANLRAIYDAFGVTGTRLRLNSIGDAADRPAFRQALRDYFTPYVDVLSETSRARLDTNPLRILDTKVPAEQALLVDAPRITDFLGDEARAHHDAVKALLDALGIPFVEDPLLVRGLDYYTRTVFELESDALGAQGALGAGGRYDGLAETLGSKVPVPAVGYAAGIERLFIALHAQGTVLPTPPVLDAFLVGLDEAAAGEAFALAQTLRHSGLSVDFALDARSAKAQMKAADRSGARVAVLLGPDERAAGSATVRDLGSREQVSVQLADAAAEVRRRLGA
jgi:histidyl-tRNA synthetase